MPDDGTILVPVKKEEEAIKTARGERVSQSCRREVKSESAKEGEGGGERKPSQSARRRLKDEATEPSSKISTPPPKTSAAKRKPERRSSSKKTTSLPSSSLLLPSAVFPGFAPPTPEAVQKAHDALADLHGLPQPPGALDERQPVLDSLVRTILSQNTTDATSARAFAALKRAFPTWKAVLAAPPPAVHEAIHCGGLAEIKGERVARILQWLLAHRSEHCAGGEPSMEYLRGFTDAEVKEELSQFNGVGPKTVACVLMFALDRHEFPVDTHVWRIARDRLKWVPPHATRETTYAFLNASVPDRLKYTLHVLLVRHGKVCLRCSKKPSRDAVECPLRTAAAADKTAAAAVGSAATAAAVSAAAAAAAAATAGIDAAGDVDAEEAAAADSAPTPEASTVAAAAAHSPPPKKWKK